MLYFVWSTSSGQKEKKNSTEFFAFFCESNNTQHVGLYGTWSDFPFGDILCDPQDGLVQPITRVCKWPLFSNNHEKSNRHVEVHYNIGKNFEQSLGPIWETLIWFAPHLMLRTQKQYNSRKCRVIFEPQLKPETKNKHQHRIQHNILSRIVWFLPRFEQLPKFVLSGYFSMEQS